MANEKVLKLKLTESEAKLLLDLLTQSETEEQVTISENQRVVIDYIASGYHYTFKK